MKGIQSKIEKNFLEMFLIIWRQKKMGRKHPSEVSGMTRCKCPKCGYEWDKEVTIDIEVPDEPF